MKVRKEVRLQDLGLEFRLLAQGIKSGADLALQLQYMVATAKALCPIDTGALMASIRWERRARYEAALIAGGGGFINPRTGREVDYARYVHDGTYRMPARPFLLQAIILNRLRFIQRALYGTRRVAG